jgi:hypothetical protein
VRPRLLDRCLINSADSASPIGTDSSNRGRGGVVAEPAPRAAGGTSGGAGASLIAAELRGAVGAGARGDPIRGRPNKFAGLL